MAQFDWNATISVIRDALPQTQFQNWIKPVEFLRADERTIVLGVPSRFHEDWLRSHYSSAISSAIRKQCGNELQLEFEVLVQEENIEASRGELPFIPPPTPVPPPPPAPGQRPNLRIVPSTNAPAPAQTDKSEPASTGPNSTLPQFGHAYVEMGFNRMAFQCAELFSRGDDLRINPMVIVAGVGMGKSHLLSEVGTRIRINRPNLRVRYTSGDSFTNEMVRALKSNDLIAFKRVYSDETDILLFDDLHILSGRLRTQETLLHIFNEIVARGGRVCFASGISPHKLSDFIDPLKSRILSGILAEVRFPSFEERVGMLAKVCEISRMAVEAPVLRALADKGQKDIRELLGSLFRLHLQATLQNQALDTSYLAKEGFVQEAPREVITMDEIISLVEHNFGIARTELMSKSRKGAVTWARQVAMYLARIYTLLPLAVIGKSLGRDHATVIYASQKVNETMQSQPTRRYEVEFLKKKLDNRASRGADDLPI